MAAETGRRTRRRGRPGSAVPAVRRRRSPLLMALLAIAAGLPVSPFVAPVRAAGEMAGWSAVESMQAARAGHTATALGSGDAVLFAGGADGAGRALRSAELFLPGSGTPPGWQSVGDLVEARTGHTATLLPNGKVLVAGGVGRDGKALASAELYDPVTKTWALTGAMPAGGCGSTCARSGHAATLLGNDVLAAGGLSQGAATSSAVVYDVDRGTWSETGAMGIARSAPTVTFVDGSALVVGGEQTAADCKPEAPAPPDPSRPVTAGAPADARPLASAERYDPDDGVWKATPPVSTPRTEHAAVALGNGRVLVAGGTGCGPDGWERGEPTQLATSEVYDAAADRWAPVKAMAVPRARHTATLLANNKVLVAGGVGRDAAVLASAETYDPTTDTWAPAGGLVTGRAAHATVALSGTVVTAGGLTRTADPAVATALAEVFDHQAAVQRPSVVRLDPPAGLAHQAVAITGAGFTDASTVTFGGTPAVSVDVESPTRITAVSPPRHGTGEVAVRVTSGPGGTSRDIRASRFRYVAVTGSWTPTADMPSAVAGPVATVLSGPACAATPVPPHCGTVLVTGNGDRGHPRYDPEAAGWRQAVITGQFHWMPGHTATLLGDGKVLGVGIESGGTQGSARLYDPREETKSDVGPAGRNRHTATELGDGTVLLAGGEGGGAPLDSSAVFATGPARLTPVAGPMGEARAGHTAVRLAGARCAGEVPATRCGQVLVAGGLGLAGRVLASAELYDPGTAPASGAWNGTLPLATPRAGHTMTSLPDGRVLVVGGSDDDGATLASAELYDPATGTWSPAGSLSVARSGHSATLLTVGCASHCGKVLVAGGTGADGEPLSSAELYDPAATAATAFTPTAALRTGRSGHAAAELPGGGVLVVGGRERRGGVVEPVGTSAELFAATASPVVTGLDPVSGPTFGGTEVTVRGSGLFAASVRFGDVPATSVRYVSDLELVAVAPAQPQGDVVVTVTALTGPSSASRHARYTYGSGAWATQAAMSDCADPRRDLGAAVGEAGVEVPPKVGQTRDFVGVSTEACSARYGHTATLLPDGRVLVAGGTADWRQNHQLQGYVPVLASAQVYDPATGTWRPTAPMTVPRARHTATLLPDGRVLVAGGATDDNVKATHSRFIRDENSAEIYDPRTETWTATGPLNHARYAHTATLLQGAACQRSPTQCGKVLVVGGTVSSDYRVPLASVELYDPANGTWALADPLYGCAPADSCVSRVDHTATLLATGEVLVSAGFGMSTAAPTPPECHRQPTFPASCDQGLENSGAETFSVEALRSAQLWDPASGTWRPTGRLARGRGLHTATMLERQPCGASCGHVLVAGGLVNISTRTTTSSAELYDPAADGGRGAWRSAPSLLDHPRAVHTATLLVDGTVAVAGGGPGFNEMSRTTATAATERSAEVFDPVTGRWRRTSSLNLARGLQTATLLDGPPCRAASPPAYCGSVLLAGGTGVMRSETVDPGVPLPPLFHPWVLSEDPAEGVGTGQVTGKPTVHFQPAVDRAELYTPAPRVDAVNPELGPAAGGTAVTMSGRNFVGVTGVTLGGVAAPTFEVASPTVLRAMSPPHAGGPVDVAVVNAGGTSATLEPDPAFTYVGTAGPVGDLVALPRSDSRIELQFSSVDDGTTGRLATKYQIRFAEADIPDAAAFDAATPLCGGVCTLPSAKALSVGVGGLAPGTTYHFALRAVNALGEAGPLSKSASATTHGVRPSGAAPEPPPPVASCPEVSPGPGQVRYSGRRYSLIGLPGGTRVAAQSSLFGWADQGAGGAYSVLGATEAVAGGLGYWGWFRCPTIVDLAPGATSARLPLQGYHATMVGNPSTAPAAVSGHDFAARWDPDANGGAGGYHVSGYQERQSLAVGQGVWVFSYRDTTIEVTG